MKIANKMYFLLFIVLSNNVSAQTKQDTSLLSISLKYALDSNRQHIFLLKRIPTKIISLLKKEKIDFKENKINVFNMCIDCPYRKITAIVKIKDIFFIHYYHGGRGSHWHLLICKESCTSFIVVDSFTEITTLESFRFFIPKIIDCKHVEVSKHW